MKCENCGNSPAEPTPIDCGGGREITMRLCETCVEDLETYGEFTRGKYKSWSEGE
jgi:protein-arginine kinase activator protein McsA